MNLQTLAIVSLSILLGAGQDGATGGGVSSVSRVSVSSTGAQGNGASFNATISHDGQTFGFESDATNIAPGADNGQRDLFRRSGTVTEMIAACASHSTMSADGEILAYKVKEGLSPWYDQIYVWEQGFISYVGQGTEPSITADGLHVVFEGIRQQLFPEIWIYHRASGVTELVSIGATEWCSDPDASSDGHFVVFETYPPLVPEDQNGTWDIYVADTWAHTVTCASLGPGGVGLVNGSWDPKIDAQGRYVLYWTHAWNAYPGGQPGDPSHQVVLRDLWTGAVWLVSHTPSGKPGNLESYSGDLDAKGRFAVFHSFADDLVPGDANGFADWFVFNRVSGRLVNLTRSGNGWSIYPAIAGDGSAVTGHSFASNLLPWSAPVPDTNGTWDAYAVARAR